MKHEEYVECPICGFEFSQELVDADRDFAIELHNQNHHSTYGLSLPAILRAS